MVGTIVWVIIAVLITLVIILVGIGIIAWIIGYYEVRSEPRGPMLLCDTHGPINDDKTVEFVGVKYCILCFHEKNKLAEKGILGKKK